jgi:hypothetical protein
MTEAKTKIKNVFRLVLLQIYFDEDTKQFISYGFRGKRLQGFKLEGVLN